MLKISTIVFNAYDEGPSTKDMAHMRKTKRKLGTRVLISSNKIIVDKKENFLTNQQSKQQLVNLMSETVRASSVRTTHAKRDADCLILLEALEVAELSPTAVVGKDSE